VKRTGASLVVQALEQVGVRYTFGIPGVHNTEIYDELNRSEKIQPVLVTHELGAAFMADGVSRTSDTVGTLCIVPAAGTTHAMSGIGEAYLDGVPMLVITGGIRRDSGKHYQLHQIDQRKLVEAVVKGSWVITDHAAIVPTIHAAYDLAISGVPGPVFIEVPVELQLFRGEVPDPPAYVPQRTRKAPDPSAIREAARLLHEATRPGIYLGWGAREASADAARVAELLDAPVATTLQGLSVFPSDHPLHVGMGYGRSAVPAAENAFRECDALLAVGLRFAELGTASYGQPVPRNLVHVDIDPTVFHKNYPARIAVESDAADALRALASELAGLGTRTKGDPSLAARIAADKAAYAKEWTGARNAERVSPGHFFVALRRRLPDDAYLAVDDGNHTFLAAELFPCRRSKHFVSPTDYNAMGYCVPAAIGIKLAHPESQVVGIVGDGAFLMTGLELLTASTLNLGVVICVFHDGELAQISQFQQVPLNRKTCTVLGKLGVEGVAHATGAAFVAMRHDGEIESALDHAFAAAAKGQPAIVDVRIDYSKKTRFTQGVVKTNLGRFPLGEKVRFIGRAIARHTLG